jgi:hypothetical protein
MRQHATLPTASKPLAPVNHPPPIIASVRRAPRPLQAPVRLSGETGFERVPVGVRTLGDPLSPMRRLGVHEVAPVGDRDERTATELGDRIAARGGVDFARVPVRAPSGVRRSDLARGPGCPAPEPERRAVEHALGQELGTVRVHQDASAHAITALAGARALTHRGDVFLGDRESLGDSALLTHELVHAATASDDRVYARRGTWLERRAWKAFFDHYLPRKFLDHYMDDVGTPLKLTRQEMIDCNATVDIRRSVDFRAEVARLQKAGGGSSTIAVSGPAGARTNGTLGNFTIHYKGSLVVEKSGAWTFDGTIDYYDYWDFDPKGSGSNRPLAAELKVRLASVGLPGQPFAITSELVPAMQRSTDSAASWGAAKPVHVPDKAGRTGADIVTGDVAGGEVGAEVGAQSSEDLNK